MRRGEKHGAPALAPQGRATEPASGAFPRRKNVHDNGKSAKGFTFFVIVLDFLTIRRVDFFDFKNQAF